MAKSQNVRGTRKSSGRKANARLVRYSASPGVRAVVDQGGRILIPAEVRRALGIAPGDSVELRVEDDTLRVRSLAGVVREAQERVRRLVPEGESLVDELLAERRREVDGV